MNEFVYFVEIYDDHFDYQGIERFLSKEAAISFIHNYSDGVTHFELFEAKQIFR